MEPSASRLYFDYNATAPLRPEAREAMAAAFGMVGNPSSIHAEGREARAVVEKARGQVAALAGTSPRSLIFTSGGTEAANLALTPTLARGRSAGCDILLVGAGEHPCVLAGHRFSAENVFEIPLNPSGRLDLEALADTLAAHPDARPMLALQAANNETGVLQPVTEAVRQIHARGGLLMCDAVQVAGRLPMHDLAVDADAFILSAHKLGGPKGAGALALCHEDLHILGPTMRGGGQERGQRGGTENVAAIAGFGAAADVAAKDTDLEAKRVETLRTQLEAHLLLALPELIIFGRDSPRLPNTSALAMPGLSAETLLMALDLEGLAISSGSACSSGKVKPSHVLASMGVPESIARGALRISLGWATSTEDVERFCGLFEKTIRNVAGRRRRSAA